MQNVISILEKTLTAVKDVVIPQTFYDRMRTNNEVLDGFLGDGIVPGSAISITGWPGSGKTTYVLQLLSLLQANGYKVGYSSGEQSVEHIAYMCKRLNITDLAVANITNVEKLCEMSKDLDCLVVDSFQTLTTKHITNTRAHEEYCLRSLLNSGTTNQCTMLFIHHHTKAGTIKGTCMVSHAVDTVMTIRKQRIDSPTRIFEITKNRNGPTGEIGFPMNENGYDFIPVDTLESLGNRSNTKTEQELKTILESLTKFTLDDLTSLLKINMPRAYYLVRNLLQANRIKKTGWGKAAIYEKQ